MLTHCDHHQIYDEQQERALLTAIRLRTEGFEASANAMEDVFIALCRSGKRSRTCRRHVCRAICARCPNHGSTPN